MTRQSPLRSVAVVLAVLTFGNWSSRARCQDDPAAQRSTSKVLTEEQVEERLDEITRLELREVPLVDAVHLIGEEHNLPVFLDRRALQDVGIDSSTLVSADYRNLSLGQALELMLRDLDLVYLIDEGAVLITTPEEAEDRLQTRVYSVHNLVHVYDWMLPPEARQAQGKGVDFDTLISLVTTIVAPHSWDAVGGPGTIQPLPPDLLIVTQTRAIHEELGNLLDALRKLPTAAEQPGIALEDREELLRLVGRAIPVGDISSRRVEIRSALESPTMIEVLDLPLRELVREIERRHDIPIELDLRALQDVGVDTDVPITAQFRNVSLRNALELLLDEYGLAFLVADEMLLITTEEEAEQRLSLRVYPVIDLVVMRSEEESWLPMDFDALLQAITTTIDQASWDVVGGPGSLHPFPQRAAIVVHQTQQVHEEIESLLADIRQHRFAAGPPDAGLPSAREQVVTQAYPLATGDLSEQHQQALRSVIQQTVRPDSWGTKGDEERFITFLPGKIIVHNRHDVQEEVRQLLLRLGIVVPQGAMGGGLGGGMGGGGLGGGGFGGGGF